MTTDDELPQPPAGPEVEMGGDGKRPEVSFIAEMTADLLDDVPGMNEPIPQGTYIYRLKSFVKETDKDNQPRYMVQWSCQQEPNTGRILRDYIQWVDEATMAQAADRGHIRHKEAKEIIRKRLPRAKELMKVAGFKPVGKFNFDEFLSSSPEVKIPTTITERKEKDTRETVNGGPNPDFGKYTISTGDKQNGLPNAYISVVKPS